MFKFKKNKKGQLLQDEDENGMLINSRDEEYHLDDVEDSRQEMSIINRKRSGSGSYDKSNQSNPNSNAKRRKISDRYMLNSSINDIKPLDDDIQDDEEYRKKYKKCQCCSWKCVCITSTLTFIIVIVITLLVLCFSVAPKFAQTTLDNASMVIINGTISNPTNSTITLQTMIQISNAGFLNGSIHESTVTVSNNGITIGTMKMPALNTIANQNTMISIQSVLEITNLNQFKVIVCLLINCIHN